MTITITSAAESYKLATVTQLKAILGITTSTDDTLMGVLLDRASAQVVGYCNQGFAKETITETLSSNGGYNLKLTRKPIVSITSITYDGTLVDASEYTLQEPAAGFVYNNNGWNCTYGEYLYSVVYVAGYVLPSFTAGTINLPLDITAACLDIAKTLYLNKDSDPTISKESVPDVYDATYGSTSNSSGGTSAVLQSVNMLNRYKRFNI